MYIWAAVLDADAFQAFKKIGDILNSPPTAKFRELLTKCRSDEGMVIYSRFGGKATDIKPLLQRRVLE